MSIEPEVTGDFERRLMDRLSSLDAARPSTATAAPATATTANAAARRRWSRPAIITAGAAVVLAAGAAATAATLLDNPPDLQAAATDVHPAGDLFLKGSGCRTGDRVPVAWDGERLTTTTAGDGGLFAVTVTVPPDAAIGPHTVTARCGDAGRTLRLAVTVTPARPPEPMPPDFAIGGSAVTGGQFVVKGAGCLAGAPVAFTTAGRALGSATADDVGGYTAVLSAGGLALGDHRVTATCTGTDGSPLTRTATLTVVAPDAATATKPAPKPTP
ncbi:MAG TPA: hypothetical protein VKB69_04110 [Micromonosporaceae bacterium]|nr:hypothetical protein [Micromonosporaceae bacterium]